MTEGQDRNLALELVRVTEASALAAARLMGRGEIEAADRAAADAMGLMLRSVAMNGTVRVGGGGDSRAQLLRIGDSVGSGIGPDVDVAVDPVDGIRLLAYGRSNALSIVAVAEKGSMLAPGPVGYMSKIAVGSIAAGAIDITASVERNLRAIARAHKKDLDDLAVVVLDRPRHGELIAEIRDTGARIRLITDGDVAGAMMAALPGTGVDALLGTGGTTEAIIAACAVKCLGGAIQCRAEPRDDAERQAAAVAGFGLNRVYSTEDLVAGRNVFFAATGITDGEVLRGVQYHGTGARTHSLSVRSLSGTLRFVDASHHWEKLMAISQVKYDSAGGP